MLSTCLLPFPRCIWDISFSPLRSRLLPGDDDFLRFSLPRFDWRKCFLRFAFRSKNLALSWMTLLPDLSPSFPHRTGGVHADSKVEWVCCRSIVRRMYGYSPGRDRVDEICRGANPRFSVKAIFWSVHNTLWLDGSAPCLST
jgi:hypothetical protein